MIKKAPEEQFEYLRALLEFNVRRVVEHEDDVRIQADQTPGRIVFTIFVNYEDMGLVLGNGGKVANSIRAVAWAACKKTDFKIDIDILTGGRVAKQF